MPADYPEVPSRPLPRHRILCADDNRFIREALVYILQSADYIVECAEDGRQALQYIAEAAEPFHALITDHDMPYVNGLELVRELKFRSISMAVIVISGSLDDEGMQAYEELGVKKILQKPFMSHAVVEAVAEILPA